MAHHGVSQYDSAPCEAAGKVEMEYTNRARAA